MFITPIRHVPLVSLEDVFNFSHCMHEKNDPFIFWQNNGQIAFTNGYGIIHVTPYRNEIRDILKSSGYKEQSFFVPFSNGEPRPEEYQWLAKIADEESWAYTFEKASKIASEKGILPVEVTEKYQIKRIFSTWDDEIDHKIYYPLTMKYLMNETDKNVGTYIYLDERNIVVCDEYGRTYFVRAHILINDLVNSLIKAGYTRTLHPERYVHKYEPEVKEDTEE